MFPIISEELLIELDDRFPNESAKPDATINTLMYQGGQRSVVEFLKGKFSEQTERQLTGEKYVHIQTT